MHCNSRSSAFFGLITIFGSNLIAQEGKVIDKPGKRIKLARTYKNQTDYVTEKSLKTSRVEESGDKFVFLDEKGAKKAEKQKEKSKIVGRMVFTTEEKDNLKQHKGVIKPTVDYKVLGNGAFLLETHRETSFNSEGDVSRAKDVERMLYDSAGKKILDLPLSLNQVIVAPDSKHFLGYYVGEVGARNIYFYDANGALLKNHELKNETYGGGPKYSPNGQVVLFFNNDDNRTVDVFNSQGDILWSYKAEAESFCKSGYGCVSNSGELVACLSKGFSIIKKSKMVSNKNLPIVGHDCEFTDDEQTLMVYVGKKGKRAIKLMSFNGGELDSMELGNVVEIKGMGADTVVIQSTGGVNEYQIK